jgi:polyisoprenoid-binding protein YceI
MRRSIIGWVLAGLVVVAGIAVVYLYFAGGSGEPSTELTTPTIAAEATTSTAGTETPASTVGTEVVAFVIDPARSTAAFEIDEVLRGEPQQVVGTTSEVAGQFQIDPSDLSTIQFSQILVNARTFETDSGNRDRAIRGPVILNSASDEFEFITFDVSSVEGVEGTLAAGQSLTFTVTGELLIRDTVNPVTFDVMATMVDEGTLEGSAEATVLRSDYGIGIPNAPGVADVGDDVLIRLDFVATS